MRRAASRTPPAAAAASPASSSRCARTACDPVVPEPAPGRRRRARSQAGRRALDHRDRDDPVERHHRPGRERARAGRTGRGSAASRCPRPGGLVVERGDRRLQLVRADRCRRRASPVISATPSLDRRRGPSAAVLLGERDERAVGRRARGRRASVSSISASSPATSPSSGRSACSWRVSRIASAVSSTRCSDDARARGVALVEDQVEHVEHGARAARALGRRRQLEPAPRRPDPLLGAADALRDRGSPAPAARGRSRRWSARRRRAGSARPASRRRATGWQHRNSSCSVSSSSATARRSGGSERRRRLLAAPAGRLVAPQLDPPPRRRP